MLLEEDTPPAPPPWIVTYADLMSLLLGLFVMLVSMSELKQGDKFEGLAESLYERFGQNDVASVDTADAIRPRSAALAALAASGRSQRQCVMRNEPPDHIASARLADLSHQTPVQAK
jgi:flagellar motor protein MotB